MAALNRGSDPAPSGIEPIVGAETTEPGERAFEEGRRVVPAEAWQNFDEGQPRGIVDRDMEMVPADAAIAAWAGAVAGDAVRPVTVERVMSR
ncbi:hypothetical protein [Bosea sp. 2KB_26]|uniref:hypothetical protein n=1 Tax=Bosea sp. 2KB_26 TaxID=3237475 RepID=UPI003F90AB4A